MYIFFIFALIFFILGFIIKLLKTGENQTTNEYRYIVKKSPMTDTERKFLYNLKSITDKYNLIILPQIQLQSIFKTTNNDMKSFNKIKSKSIDFAIVNNDYEYKLFIELDDYTHNKKSRIERDNFVNELFSIYKLNLKRIKVSSNYNLEELESIIKEVAI